MEMSHDQGLPRAETQAGVSPDSGRPPYVSALLLGRFYNCFARKRQRQIPKERNEMEGDIEHTTLYIMQSFRSRGRGHHDRATLQSCGINETFQRANHHP